VTRTEATFDPGFYWVSVDALPPEAAGFGAAGVVAVMLGWTTPAAFLFMITGLLMIMADAHIDPLALITEDSLHPDDAEVAGPPGGGTRL
jgi:hypothetical protein